MQSMCHLNGGHVWWLWSIMKYGRDGISMKAFKMIVGWILIFFILLTGIQSLICTCKLIVSIGIYGVTPAMLCPLFGVVGYGLCFGLAWFCIFHLKGDI